MILVHIFTFPSLLNHSDIIKKEEMKEDIRKGWAKVCFSCCSFVFLVQLLRSYCLINNKALACFMLYRKTLSTAGITCLIDTQSTTRQVAKFYIQHSKILDLISKSTNQKSTKLNTNHFFD